MKKLFFSTCLISLAAAFLLHSNSVYAAEPLLADYTSHPIFTVNPVTPNIMIIMDNSGSMNFNAYGTYPGDGGIVTDVPYAGIPYKPTIETRVSTSWDDAEEYHSNGNTWNSNDLDIGNLNNSANNSSTRVMIGLRFQDLKIPVGSEITNAYVEFKAYNADPGTAGDVTLNIFGEDTGDAPTFASTNSNISSRTKTTASVSWSPPVWAINNTYQTDNIKTILQEIVDRDDWKPGNDVALIIEHAALNGYRRAIAEDFSGAAAPLLHIEYTQAADTYYYGYFNPEWFYTYGSNKFSHAFKKVSYDTANTRWNVTDTNNVASTLTDAQIVANSLYDGNFMNWVCMRRVDVARKVLMGGLATSRTGGGNQVNYGETPAQSSRTYIREFMSNDGTVNDDQESAVSPYDTLNDNYYYGVKGGYLYIDDDNDPFDNNELVKLKIAIQKSSTYEPDDFVDGNISGVLQTIGDQAYWGNASFNSSGTGNNKEGGSIDNAIGSNITNLVTTIQNTGADTWTPLAEAYYIVMQYFKQEAQESGLGYPNNAPGSFNNTMDPYYQNGDFISCAKSFVIYLTDGASTKDSKIPAALKDFDGDGTDNTNCVESTNTNCDYSNGGTDYLDDVALYARTTDLRADLDGDQNIILYPIYAFGNDSDARNLLIDAAKNGGFEEKDGVFGPSATNEWDENLDGLPDSFFEASDGNVLRAKLLEAIYDILARAASGTAVSVLATSSEGEGNLVQAYFKPSVTTGLIETKWVGFLQSLWVDSKGFLREDTNANQTLDLDTDKVITYFTDLNGDTKVNKFDVAPSDEYPDVENDTPTETELDQISSIWEAGDVLSRTLPDLRTIYTYTSGSDWVDFNNDSSAKVDVIKPYLGVQDLTTWSYLGTTHDDRASNLIHFVRGNDSGFTGTTEMRTRTLNGLTWPLGDIVNSTPVSIAPPPENFGVIYQDESYQQYFNYHKGRSDHETMVYVGANDGMLHAFTSWQYDSTTKSFSNPDPATNPGEEIGTEIWSYIPRALLPHLKWHPRLDYTHVYYVDLKPKITDAKIFYNTLGDPTSGTIDNTVHMNGWGTVLLGGLRLGGKSISVTDDFDYDAGTADTTETFTSSYFAIDISDPRNPQFMWEKTYDDLELTVNEPAIVKVNEKWFAVFGSGPEDYEGTSSKKAHLFIVDLATGTPYKSTGGDDWIFEADDNDGFFGTAASLDKGLNFSVDSIYVGESHQVPSGDWEGALYKISVPFECNAVGCDIADESERGLDYGDTTQGDYYEDPNGDSISGLYEANSSNNPWLFHKLFDSPSPITAPPALSIDAIENAWVYFGTGRYFSNDDKSNSDAQYLFGIKDPFFNDEHVQSGGTFSPDASWHNYTRSTSLTLDTNDLFDADSYKIIFPWGCTEAPQGDCSTVPTGQVGDIYADGSCECTYESWYRCTEVTLGSCAAAGVDQAAEEVWDDGDCVCRVLNPTWGCEETVTGSGACDGIGEGRLGDVNGDGSCTCFYWEAVEEVAGACDTVDFGTVGAGIGVGGKCEATKPAPTGYACTERPVGDCSAVTTGTLGDINNDGGSCECSYFNCTEAVAGGCDDLDYLSLPASLTFPDVQGDGSCMCAYVEDPEAVVVTNTGLNALTFEDIIGLSRLEEGWVRSLAIPKERNLTKPAILGGLSLFTSYVPNSASCAFGGTSYLYALYFETGTANQDPVFDDATEEVAGVIIIRDRLELGLGMASGVGIHVGQEEGGKAKAFIQQSTGVIKDINLDPAFNIRSGLTSWQEQ